MRCLKICGAKSKDKMQNWKLVMAAGLFAVYSFRPGDQARYLTAKIEQGDIRDEVEATGVVNAVVTVQVGSQVSGTIAKLNADLNSRVRRGEVIALIDAALFQGAASGSRTQPSPSSSSSKPHLPSGRRQGVLSGIHPPGGGSSPDTDAFGDALRAARAPGPAVALCG